MFGAEQRVEEKYTLSQAILRWAYLHSISALYCLFCTEDTMNDTSNHNVGFQGSWCFFFPPPYSGHNKDIASPWEFGASDNCCHGWYHKSKLSWLYGGDIQVRALTVHTLYLSTEMKSESKIHVLGKSKRAERVRRWTAFFEQAQFKPFGPTHERFYCGSP